MDKRISLKDLRFRGGTTFPVKDGVEIYVSYHGPKDWNCINVNGKKYLHIDVEVLLEALEDKTLVDECSTVQFEQSIEYDLRHKIIDKLSANNIRIEKDPWTVKGYEEI